MSELAVFRVNEDDCVEHWVVAADEESARRQVEPLPDGFDDDTEVEVTRLADDYLLKVYFEAGDDARSCAPPEARIEFDSGLWCVSAPCSAWVQHEARACYLCGTEF